MAPKLDEIRTLAERLAASHGLEIVEIEFAGGGKPRTLRVFIEKNAQQRADLRERAGRLRAIESRAEDRGPEAELEEEDRAWLEALPGVENLELLSGVTHEDCEIFSQDFGVVLDVEELMPAVEYLLEVSSPGLDRKLTRLEEFERFQGCLAKVQVFEAVQGKRRWQARITGVGPGLVRFQMEATPGPRKKKTGAGEAPVAFEVAWSNIEKASLVAEL